MEVTVIGSPECLLLPAYPPMHTLLYSHRKSPALSFKVKGKSIETYMAGLCPSVGNAYFLE